VRSLLIVLFVFIISGLFGQTKIEWTEGYKLKLSDFQSPSTKIGNVNRYFLQTGSSFDFEFSMSSYEFMFTKNFNNKVDCYFSRNIATLIAPDTSFANDLINFEQFAFDLSELYARKLRKELFENKAAFSSYDFFHEYFDKIQNEYTERYSEAGNVTDLGRNKDKLKELHKNVLDEIHGLSEFCKSCKPKKTKIKKRK